MAESVPLRLDAPAAQFIKRPPNDGPVSLPARTTPCIFDMATKPAPESWQVERSAGGIRLSGCLVTADAAAVVRAVRDSTPDGAATTVDLGDVKRIDGSVIALMREDMNRRSVRAEFLRADRFRALFDLYANDKPPTPRGRPLESSVARIGRATLKEAANVERAIEFVGEFATEVGSLFRSPRRAHWRDILPLVERAGADAVPIVLVVNLLVGFVMAYMSARALEMFGANIYAADLVAIAMTRQLGPVMTAVVVCGRSGAGFAAELGSMRVSEELDALRTLGIQPILWLVVPRIIALALVVPVLTLLADLIGIIGGAFVAVTSLGLTARAYFAETRTSVTAWDFESGLVMSLAFALTIALIACHQGLSATGGAQGVGRRTTSTVVASLFAIVLLDALLTVTFRVFGGS